MQEGDTIMKAVNVGSGRTPRWEYEFHPELTLIEQTRSVLDFIVRSYRTMLFVSDNPDRLDGRTYAEAEEMGRSYMVGPLVSMEDYRKTHTNYINKDHWLAFAVEWAFENPDKRMTVNLTGRREFEYDIYARGDDFVEIGLPHHGKGGEKHWIVHTDNRRRRLLINVD